VAYYVRRQEGKLAEFINDRPDLIDRAAFFTRVQVGDETFQIMTTHFTWSGKGAVSDEQRQDYAELSKFMAKFNELIFCGDLNTPRGYEIWDDLAANYMDNIPLDVETTIDKNLHKSGLDIRLVIDALFTTPHYSVREVHMVPNTSDHMAVVGEIERVNSPGILSD
jgi:endonuclease/exonuclease/phosphatase family metal-dependent hydrolase